jgi:hypothetical protein
MGEPVCQFGGTYPYCWDEPNPPPPEPDPCADPYAYGCGGGGGGGGGGGTAPTEPEPEPEPADTCRTGDPIVDDPEVSQGLALLWQQSNPDANMWQRKEKAGWIVEYPAGQFSVLAWTGGTESFACGDYPAQSGPSQGKIVGFVHTHPYSVGEAIANCQLTQVTHYKGVPSGEDRKTSIRLGAALGMSAPLPGYIIDKDGYYRFQGSTNTATPRRQRCGY